MQPRALLLCLAVAPALHAQRAGRPRPDPEVVRELEGLLRSGRLDDLAWAGYLAGRHGVRSATPALRGALAGVRELRTVEERFAAMALLDGLIRIEAEVPPGEIEPFLRGKVNDPVEPALVLLARHPVESAPALLRYFRRLGDPELFSQMSWLAAGNLLARAAAHGFARELLDGLQLELVVHVRAPGDDRPAIGPRRARYGVMCQFDEIPDGFPPVATYELGSAGARCLAPGESSVLWTRHEIGTSDDWRCRGALGKGLQEQRVIWIGVLLGEEGRRPLPVRSTHTVRFRDDETFVHEVAELRQQLQSDFSAVAQRLVRRGRLSRRAAETRAQITLVLRNHLEGRELPDLPVK